VGWTFLEVLLVRVLDTKVCLEDLESNIGIHKRIEIGHVIPLKLLLKTRGGAEAIQDIEAKELPNLFDTEGVSELVSVCGLSNKGSLCSDIGNSITLLHAEESAMEVLAVYFWVLVGVWNPWLGILDHGEKGLSKLYWRGVFVQVMDLQEGMTLPFTLSWPWKALIQVVHGGPVGMVWDGGWSLVQDIATVT
jgi:hypothetical protein